MGARSVTWRWWARPTAVLAVLAVLAGLVGLGVVAAGGPAALHVRFGLVVAAIVAATVGVLRNRPSRRRPWWLLVAGLTLSAVGDAIVLTVARAEPLTANVPADAWLTAVAGLLILIAMVDVTRSVGGAGAIGPLDAVITGVASGTLLWQLLVVPAATPGWSGSGTELAGAVQVGALIAVGALLLRVVFMLPPGRRVAAVGLFVAVGLALTAFLVGAVRDATGTGDAYSGLRAVAGAATNLAVGAAVLHPSMRWLTTPRVVPFRELPLARSLLLGGALTAPPLVVLLGTLLGRPVSIVSVALAWTVLAVAVMIRSHRLQRGREAQQIQLDRSERRLLSLIANTGDAVLLVAVPDGGRPTIRFASPSSQRLLGSPAPALADTPVEAIVTDEDRDTLAGLLASAGGLPCAADVRVHHADGTGRWVEAVVSAAPDEDVRSAVLTLRDVDLRKRSELQLAEAASRDELTGLWNRRAFQVRLSATLSDRPDPPPQRPDRRRGPDLAVLLADLDGFKQVNDRAGHPVGDEVMRVTARRLESAVRDHDLVARLGGDEFAVLCRDVDEVATVVAIAERIVAACADPIEVQGGTYRVGCSVGLAMARDHEAAAALIERADGALYAAKRAGRGRAVVAEGDERLPSGTSPRP